MHLRAKFYIQGVTLLPGTAGVKLDLGAVSRGDRNAEWAQATPIGTISMTINNPSAAQHVEDFMQAARRTGKQPELFVDIAPSTDGWPGDGHAFRLAEIPEGVYGHGKCGECGLGKDDDLTEWDPALRTSVVRGKGHPNG